MRLPQLPATVPTSEAEVPTQSLDGLSARERNALKRKRKAFSKGNAGPPPTPVSSSAGVGMSTVPPSITESTQTPKFRIIEQPSSSSDDPHGRVAVPTPTHYTISQAALSSENQPPTNSKHGSGAEPPISSKVIIDPGAKAQARKAALGQLGSPSGGEVNAVAPSQHSSSPLYYKEGEWPFTSFVEILMIDLFSSQWEFRHGAALTLIPLLKIQGSGAAKSVGAPRYRNSEQHQSWMEDIGLRLICLLSLDRFGDYVGDQVHAPVRETAAQAISLVGRWLDQSGVQHMLSIFHQMVEQKNVASHPQRGYAWQVRHAGLLGMKYLVAVKNEMLRVNPTTDPHKSTIDICMDESTAKPDPALEPKDHDEEMKPVAPMSHDAMDEVDAMPSVKPEPHSVHLASGEQNVPDDKCAQPAALLSMITSAALTGLRDQDDDVRAAASGALLPVTDLIVELLPTRLNELLGVLWDALGSSKDDLSSSVGNIMDLLANLITYPTVLSQLSLALGGHTLPSLIPRLFPFFRHTISNVRLSVVKTIHVFLNMAMCLTRKLNASLFYTATRNAKLTTTQDISMVYNVDKPIMSQDLSLVSIDDILCGRLGASKAIASITVENWAEEYRATSEEHKTTQLGQIPAMQPLSNRLRNSSDIEGLLATFASLGKVPTEKIPQMPSDPFTIEHASHVVNNDYQTLIPLLGRGNKKTALASLEDRRRKLLHVIGMYESDKVAFDTQIDAAAAAAVVALREIPGKYHLSLRGSLKVSRTNLYLNFKPVPPTHKIGIFSAEDSGIRPQTKNGSTHRDSPESESASAQAKLLRRGAELALSSLAARFGDNLIDRIPKLWQCMSEPLLTLFTSGDVAAVDSKMEDEAVEPKLAQDLLDCLTILPAVASSLPSSSLPRLVLLFEPLCRAVTSRFAVVRYSVVRCFAELCKFLPEEGMLHFITHVTVDVLSIKILAYIIFLVVPVLGRMSDPDDDLLGGSKIEEYDMPIKVKADLRKYQRDGISWLAFLAKYQLHGILCDDMGLGKTLQSICILASKHHERAELHTLQPSPSTVHLPSLVIKRHDVVILSYDIVRNDIERLSKISWNYCILDEGHIIKNAKSKLSQAVKLLKANHRLILSGTPIQNNALELWSLFDFLMPGFLGTEKYFNDRFGRPISASRDAKSSSKEQEAGALALEALHKQVLPFLLRRLKEDVLDDLPPKIIQDYYCELSPIQKRLYEDFSNSQAKNEAEVLIKGSKPNKSSTQHVFQALQYLKKLVNHPALVLRPDLPQHQPIISKLGSKGLRDISHAPKLLALRQILRDCGIGLTTSTHLIETVADDGGGTTASGGTIPQHRVLIFCQMKQMLDIIEHDLFKLQMPNVTYMRMDGSTDATKRHDVVQTFNSDPSIDCLLLTTHVGGLGLNLTGADTVIFVEHDWNPMKDLQAMDRAHRLGQKKVVNVYRLITRATLEEKIMGLQRFKMNIATSIVNQQNSNLGSLNTDEILDLFNISSIDGSSADPSQSNPSNSGYNGMEGQVGKKNVLDGLEDLPPESEYESLDPAKFLSSL
ncbi:hypothetical protein PSTT_15759 [Puccinia striiformis]|uniref:TATA-binding protein-associated factor MOT1 n=1 Tax=Puccinia striiformis TaxID=27350 RepID=A0A2S4UG85_9BASI|nr:hypothetical protein PSTT_15759 [Puccinia striiformis]